VHTNDIGPWQHMHDFAGIHERGQFRTTIVLLITIATMVVEIMAGAAFGSMALLADGWHMSTHAAAFLIALFAYRFAKKHKNSSRFTFGPGKVTVLGGFASAVALFAVALVMSVESVYRIFSPQTIHFNEAIGVAVLGLFVNVVCAFILQGSHEHSHDQQSGNDHHHHDHNDHNLRSAYFHVLADALTSALAICALVSGKIFGWSWLDPIMGIVAAVIITRWSISLLKQTSPILLDENIDEREELRIRQMIESDSDNRVSDLHVWKAGSTGYAVIVSLVTCHPKPVEHYKNLLNEIKDLCHVTIEVNQCSGEPCFETERSVA